MKDPLQPVDLRQNVRRGLAHICASVDRQRDCRPYFRFNLKEPPVWAQHEAADTPHTVGRFLHALDVCAEITGPARRPGAIVRSPRAAIRKLRLRRRVRLGRHGRPTALVHAPPARGAAGPACTLAPATTTRAPSSTLRRWSPRWSRQPGCWAPIRGGGWDPKAGRSRITRLPRPPAGRSVRCWPTPAPSMTRLVMNWRSDLPGTC